MIDAEIIKNSLGNCGIRCEVRNGISGIKSFTAIWIPSFKESLQHKKSMVINTTDNFIRYFDDGFESDKEYLSSTHEALTSALRFWFEN